MLVVDSVGDGARAVDMIEHAGPDLLRHAKPGPINAYGSPKIVDGCVGDARSFDALVAYHLSPDAGRPSTISSSRQSDSSGARHGVPNSRPPQVSSWFCANGWVSKSKPSDQTAIAFSTGGPGCDWHLASRMTQLALLRSFSNHSASNSAQESS